MGLCSSMPEPWTYPSSPQSANSPPINLSPRNTTLPLPAASLTMHHPTPTPTKPCTPLPWLSGPAPMPASCPDPSRAVWLAARLGLDTPHPTCSIPPPESHRQSTKTKQTLVRAVRLLQSNPSFTFLTSVTHNAPLHAHCQRILVVLASVAEAEYAANFGGGQVLVELTLTLTNLGHPQQSPPLLFVDNECAIGLDWLRKSRSQSTCVLIGSRRGRANNSSVLYFSSASSTHPTSSTKFFPSTNTLLSYPSFMEPRTLPFLHRPPPPHQTHPHHRSSRRDAVFDRDSPTIASP